MSAPLIPAAALAPTSSAPRGSVPEIDSRALFGESREVRIRHHDEIYTLRLTRLDKLILTK